MGIQIGRQIGRGSKNYKKKKKNTDSKTSQKSVALLLSYGKATTR